MRIKDLIVNLSFLASGLAGLALAMFVTSQFVVPSQSQNGGPAPQESSQSASKESSNSENSGSEEGEDDSVGEDIANYLQPFNYQADGRRDPFAPYQSIQPAEQGQPVGPLLPLQKFDLEQLKLIGIMWDVTNPKAMFQDPNGEIHVLEKDDRIGRSNGYIAVIREGEVVVVETVTIRGELAYTTRVLKITR